MPLASINIEIFVSYLRSFITITGNALLVLSFTESKRSKSVSAFYIIMGFLISLIIATLMFRPSDKTEFISSTMVLCCMIVSSTLIFYTKDGFFQTVLNIFTQINLYFIISYFAYTLTEAFFLDNVWAEIYIRITLYVITLCVSYTYLRKPYRQYIKYLHKGWVNLAVMACGFSILFTFVFLIPVPFYEREPYNNYICIASIILMLCVYAMSILSFDQAMKNVNKEILLSRREQQLHYLEGQLVTHKESDAMVKKLRHDLRHHDAVLLKMLEDGKTEQAKAFLAEHSTKIEKIRDMIYCRNTVVNSVLATYASVAMEKGCRVNIIANIPENIRIESVDLAGLLANIIENAIEACGKVKEGTPFIDMQCDHRQEALRITLRNSCVKAPDFIGGLPRTTKPGGGIGLQSVMSIVNEYDGLAKFEYQDGIFISKIMIREAEAPVSSASASR